MSKPDEPIVTDADLLSYMDEALPADDMVRVEACLRASAELRTRQAHVRQAMDHGWHSVGAIWRTHRLSCPSRSQLGSFLLGAADAEWESYVRFHLETVGCRMCQASLDDLRARTKEDPPATQSRRQRFFQSSAGLLHRKS